MFLVFQKTAGRNMRTEMLSYLGGNRGGTYMHEDYGKPNTKSAVPTTWDVVEGKARGISARAASDQLHHTRAAESVGFERQVDTL
jgi:hypothetical protein